ncbi:hypothetical protein JTE90_005932 [Oedothorax gibbosus]|uniref:PEHE domain-containing protein n=1 Tax=Oedothorax gibbosus TaxID=931172 RepID=A0AAV6UAF1_9ARAC|nr:hypothetical protein JTE90_005932 [Oedothorax gibbosus]
MRHRRRLSSSSRSVSAVGSSGALCDHLYATTCENLVAENMQLREMVVSHLDMIGQLQEELATKTRQAPCPLLDANDHKLTARVVRSGARDRRMCLVRCQERTAPVLATRYFGRKSKTIPNRALKRRYMGPPKPVPSSRALPPAVKEEVEIPPSCLLHRERGVSKRASHNLRRACKKEEASPQPEQEDYLTTDKEYFPSPAESSSLPAPVEEAPSSDPTPHINVPLWKVKPVTSFYQMEGTENINDIVFERRHQKYELDERRRKRWDLQRLREQRARTERRRRKKEKKEPTSFYPDPQSVEFIEVTDKLPVIAFGHPIPVLEPSDFSLPWIPEAKKKGRRGRPRPRSPEGGRGPCSPPL